MTLTYRDFDRYARELMGMHISQEEIRELYSAYVNHEHLNSQKQPTGDPLTEIAA